MSISVILTVYNKQDLIHKVVQSVLSNISESTKEFIVVLDGCTDNSEKYLHETLSQNKPSWLEVKIIKTDDVYEMRAANAGFKSSTTDYCILMQDDMIIMEKNFDQRLVRPLLQYDDLFAVTARNTHGLYLHDNMIDWCDVVGGPVGDRFDGTYRIPNDFDRETIHVKMTINNGPIAFDRKRLKLLDYFDETLPGVTHCFDHDLCIRARINYNWKCGAYWIWYDSRPEWGSSRSQPLEKRQFLLQQEEKNRKELYDRYHFIIPMLNISEARKVKE